MIQSKLILIAVCFPWVLWASPLRGLQALEQVDALPLLRRGVSAHQVSSFERNGGNDDRNSWLYRDDQDDYVVFDDIGAGCIYRLWLTYGGEHPGYKANYSATHIKIYLDEDVAPRFECSLAEFFSGTIDPFIFPLVGDNSVSSGGFYSYVPIPYERRCRISLTDIPPVSMREMPWGVDSYFMYYNITYHKYSSTKDVYSWTGSENYDAVNVMLLNTGADPKSTNYNERVDGQATLGANSNCLLSFVEGVGVLNSIEFEMPFVDQSQWSNIWLRIYWDEEPEAAVDVPFGEFFGSGYGETRVDGLLMGMSESHYYCYFPMPFWQSARIILENRGTGDIGSFSYALSFEDRSYEQASSGYFHARHSQGSFTNRVVAPDFVMLDEAGRGHYVGINLSITGAGKIYGNGLTFLEGDERFYIDGSLTPQLHGTGNEDYFNGGWYFSHGTFSLPYHGSPVRSTPYGMNVETNYVGAYRLHIGDIVPFNSSIRLGMEHGGINEVGCTMSSVAYYYKLAGNESGLEVCAELDVGNLASEMNAQYQGLADAGVVSNTFSYTGDNHDEWISGTGRYLNESSSFTVSLPVLNDGVVIRRKTDTGNGQQLASVYVDEAYVSDWYFSDVGYSNELQRWADCELYIPFEFTAGKTNINLRFDVAGRGASWNEYNYSVYAIDPLTRNIDMDADGIMDTWEVAYFNNLVSCDADGDADEDGFSNRDEYICLTDPRDEASLFLIERADVPLNGHDEYRFSTATSRVYKVMCSTNLITGFWQEFATVPGSGDYVFLTSTNMQGNTLFYRVNVLTE